MRIARIYYPVFTLGPGRRVGIWVSGCEHNCPGCISSELRIPENGRDMTTDEIVKLLQMIPEPIDGFTISGGEPFYDPDGLAELLKALSLVNDDIIVFTGYTYEELMMSPNKKVREAIAECAVLIDGPYIDELNDGVGLRGSANQQCYIFKYKDKYMFIEQWERELQNVSYGESFLTIGIP